MNARVLRIAAVVAALFLASWAARADDAVTITFSPISGAPGATVDVTGTIANSGPDTLNLDSDNTSVSAPLSINDEFLNNAPFTLAGGASDSFEFFRIIIDPAAAPGTYGTDNSDVFSFFGDFPLSDGSDMPVEDDVYFTVNVTSPSIVAPEPGTWLLLCAGLLALFALRRSCGRIRASGRFAD